MESKDRHKRFMKFWHILTKFNTRGKRQFLNDESIGLTTKKDLCDYLRQGYRFGSCLYFIYSRSR